VVARHPVPAHRLGQAGHAVEVQLQAGGHDEVLVGDRAAVAERHRTRIGVDRGCPFSDPGHAVGHYPGFRPYGAGRIGQPTPDQGPQRLVVVVLGRLDHRHVGDTGAAQPGGDGDTGGTTTDDDQLVMR
jgi:hypothetical protein